MSAEQIKRLIEERNRAWDQAKALLDNADSERRSMSAEEDEQWTRMNDDIDVLDKRIETLHNAETRAQRTEELRAKYEDVARPAQGIEKAEGRAVGRDLDAEMRAFLRGETRSVEITPEEDFGFKEARALVKATPSAGGYTVPTSFVPQLLVHMIEMSAIQQAGSTVFETDGGENMDWPKTTGLSTASQTAEAATIATSNPAFGKFTLGAYKYPVLTDISAELVNDTASNLLDFIAQEAGWAVGNAFGTKLVTGAGSTEPSGIITGATLGKTGSTGVAGVPSFDDLIDLQYSVIAPYRNRPSCAWLFRDSSGATIRKIKNGNGDYVWEASTKAGTPDVLLGKPTFTDPNVAAMATSAKSVLFGDMSRYFIRLVRGIRFERSDEFQFDADVITFKTVLRGDGGVQDSTGALKYFAGGAS